MFNDYENRLIDTAAIIAGAMIANGYKIDAVNKKSMRPLVLTAVTVAKAIINEVVES